MAAALARPARLPMRTTTSVAAAWRPIVGTQMQTQRSPMLQTGVRFKSGPYGYTQAKALVFSKLGEPADVLSVHTHSISPTLPPNAALLRTLAAPINPADINTVQGTYGAKPTFSALIGTAEPSSVPGSEACFEVVSVGSGVTTLKPGDWALPAAPGLGTWRTHALVDDADASLVGIPRDKLDGLTPAAAATATVNPCTAWRMLRDYVDLVALSVRAGAGAWFIQNGANSGVGRAAIQLGKLWGLRSINVVRARDTPEATAALRRELTDLGATVVVTEEELQERGFSSGRLRSDELMADTESPLLLALNCVGGRPALGLAKCLSDGGRMVTYGAMAKQPLTIPAGLLIFRDLAFHGFWFSRWGKADPAGRRQTVEAVLDLMRTGKFLPGPAEEIPWTWETEPETLNKAVAGTLEGYRSGKGIFVFKDT
ncbi:mitochondrial trans-2-enoyl-CoA reductase [Sporothrix brasiliensis 5110]|uniref:enoyl-[acyl-carrier-protein] reductase n=1 Tax=Sporothrix brasiliensis 5110 TaxID=1398154 RepID=A0A0C2IK52_9PEZI|nr:mitochondrial trans-2-enoyl-CoA reductase [Sporothrix brasiliensis 5110]KIH87355.1 mitochondrial trans-2-enoyl-CoA reductase [Sporothrix brasiliensis 5110]